MKRLQYTALALAMVCILGCSAKNAISYFTTFANAKGGVTMHLVDETTITEEVRDGKKVVVIHNNSKDTAVYVRVKAFAFIAGKDAIQDGTGTNWSRSSDGYWYYGPVLEPGEDTSELTISFLYPEDKEEGDEYEVTVVYESVPAQYPDWNTQVTPIN